MPQCELSPFEWPCHLEAGHTGVCMAKYQIGDSVRTAPFAVALTAVDYVASLEGTIKRDWALEAIDQMRREAPELLALLEAHGTAKEWAQAIRAQWAYDRGEFNGSCAARG